MRRAKLFAAFGLFAVVMCAADNPFIGVWKLNYVKSKHSSANWPKDLTMTSRRSGIKSNGSTGEKAALQASLTATGEVVVAAAPDAEKIDSVRRILHSFGREAIYDVKVVDVPEAWAGLYGRAILPIACQCFGSSTRRNSLL